MPELITDFAMISGLGQGQKYHRKVDNEETEKTGGRIVYMDTNNSSNDFEVIPHPTLYNQ